MSLAPFIVEGLADEGLAIAHGWLSPELISALADEARRRDAAGAFRAAAVGRGATRIRSSAIRGDRISWLDEREATPAEAALWGELTALREALNRALFLSLTSMECHYAIYPPGAFYAKHRDRFRDDDARVVSCVLYLNARWRASDGGALRLHIGEGHVRDILPEAGTFVSFLADRYEHEVLPALRERVAIAGWFRRRAHVGNVVGAC